MELAELRTLAVVAQEGSLTRAARRLRQSQPTVSRQVQRLESKLGVKLLIRRKAGVVLTEAGQRCLVQAERVFESLELLRREAGELTQTPSGTVSLGGIGTAVAYVLPPVIAALRRAHPNVRLFVRAAASESLEDGVARGELDLAVVRLPIRREELTVARLWKEDYVVALPARHRLAHRRRPVPLRLLANEPFVVLPGVSPMYAVEAVCRQQGGRPTIALETDNTESLRRMVEIGLGVALVPRIMTVSRKRGAQSSWRAAVLELEAPPQREIGLVHRGSAYLTAAARALRDALLMQVALLSDVVTPSTRRGTSGNEGG